MKIIFFVLLMSQSVFAQVSPIGTNNTPVFKGTFPSKDSYTIHEWETLGFVEFQSSRPHIGAPIATRVQVNQNPVTIPSQVFSERILARLPYGKAILVYRSKKINLNKIINSPSEVIEKESWEFPVGTMVAHEIRFKDSASTIFETRVIEKLDKNIWGYGAYSFSNNQYVLRKTSLPIDLSFQLQDSMGGPLNVNLKTIPQMVCARCHHNISLNQEPRNYTEEAGPCEFHPGNLTLKNAWALQFQALRGWKPFADIK